MFPSLVELIGAATKQNPSRSWDFCYAISCIAQEAMEANEDPHDPYAVVIKPNHLIIDIAMDYLRFLQRK